MKDYVYLVTDTRFAHVTIQAENQEEAELKTAGEVYGGNPNWNDFEFTIELDSVKESEEN
jgi:hypothetical protein